MQTTTETTPVRRLVTKRQPVVPSVGKFLHVFGDADLRCGHDGLAAVAKKEKLDVKDLACGDFFLFINSSRTAYKVYAANNFVLYYRAPSVRLDMSAIQYLPQIFTETGKIDYEKALERRIDKLLANGS